MHTPVPLRAAGEVVLLPKHTVVRQIARQLGSALYYALAIVPGIAFFEWTDYHTRGKSALPFVGANPRCIRESGTLCSKLDTEHLTWDAKVAMWFGQHWFFQLAAALAIVLTITAGIALIIRSTRKKAPLALPPPDRGL
jgi:hypothetical protein